MAVDYLVECTHCGSTIDTTQTERCKRCKKYVNEDPIEFEKYISKKEMEESEE
jgi:uncharacterized Zn finger protein